MKKILFYIILLSIVLLNGYCNDSLSPISDLQSLHKAIQQFTRNKSKAIDVLFEPNFSNEKLINILKSKTFKTIAAGGDALVLSDEQGLFVIKIVYPVKGISEEDQAFINKFKLLVIFKDLINKYKYHPFISWIKQELRKVILKFRKAESFLDQSIIDTYYNGYKISQSVLWDNLIKTKLVPVSIQDLNIKGIDPLAYNAIKDTSKIVLQEQFNPELLLINKMKKSVNDGNVKRAIELMKRVFEYKEKILWNRGIFDLDGSINIFDNYIVYDDDQISSHDWGSFSNDIEEISNFINLKQFEANKEIKRLTEKGNLPSSEITYFTEKLRRLKNLFPGSSGIEICKAFLEEILKRYSLSNLNQHWLSQIDKSNIIIDLERQDYVLDAA